MVFMRKTKIRLIKAIQDALISKISKVSKMYFKALRIKIR